MKVHLKGFQNNNCDAVIVIECQCGSRSMLDEAGEFQSRRWFVYRHGVPVRNLRCSAPGAETQRRQAQGRPPCRERYRITLCAEDRPPRARVAHLTPRPRDQVLETSFIEFPPKGVGPKWPLNPPPATPYVNKPYDSPRPPHRPEPPAHRGFAIGPIPVKI